MVADGVPPPAIRRRQSVLVGQRSVDIIQANAGADAGPKFVIFIIKLYRKWGFFIADHAVAAIVCCILLSAISLVKVVLTKQENDVTGYSPFGARARDEFNAYNEFFSSEGYPPTVYIFLVAKDNGSMTRLDYLRETLDVLKIATTNFTIHNPLTKKNQSFTQFCHSFCVANEPVNQFYTGMKLANDAMQKGEQLGGRYELNYPIASTYGLKFSLQPNFFGVKLVGDEDETTTENPEAEKIRRLARDTVPGILDVTGNSTDGESFVLPESALIPKPITNIKYVKMVALQLRGEHQKGWSDADVKQWEMRIVRYFQDQYQSKRVKIYVLSQSYVEEEMVRAGISLLPFLTVGFVIMCTCSVLSVMIRALYMHQENFYKMLLAVMACVSPLLGCSTALAAMFLVGVRFASILCVIPFLVLSIGVDSSYLMIHEWQRVTKEMREHPSRKDSVGYRLSEVLSEVGPAILISCLTNVFADMVGSLPWISSPEITLLCVGNLLSMCMAFIYQMTFYCGLMTLVGKQEINEDKEILNRMEVSIAANRVQIARHKQLTGLQRQPSKFHEAAKPVLSKYMKAYVDFFTHKVVATCIVILYFVYLAISAWGISRMDINLTTKKLFAADSPLVELDNLRVEYVVPHFTIATVFVQNPGNLSDSKRLDRLNQMVADFESLEGSWGPVGTKYFMRDYASFQASFVDDDDVDYTDPEALRNEQVKLKYFDADEVASFIKSLDYSYWSGFVRLENTTKSGEHQRLVKFFFTTGYKGEDLKIWTKRGKRLKEWRKVVDKYNPDFQASVYHEDGVFLDLIDNMVNDTTQAVMGTLICLAIVCFIFLNNVFTVAIASFSVLSICAGILGCLSWLGVDLDPITMAAMIISIGFSVDIPAHVSYHYYQACVREGPNSSPADRLGACLSSVAFPAVQAALSTMLCVCSLLFVNIYMSQVFVKCMISCVLLCNLHGLIFLPCILTTIDNIVVLCRRKPSGANGNVRNGHVNNGNGQPKKTSKKKAQVAPEKTLNTDRPEV